MRFGVSETLIKPKITAQKTKLKKTGSSNSWVRKLETIISRSPHEFSECWRIHPVKSVVIDWEQGSGVDIPKLQTLSSKP